VITAEPSRKVEAKTKSQIATGADVVVETLEAQGVTHVFGVPGAKIDKVFDRLRDSKIKTVVCAVTSRTQLSSLVASDE
jgi:glyoxylate carboligase